MTNSAALTLQPSQLAMAISNPGSLGTIEAYITTVNRLPVLSAEQEMTLARRLRDNEDIAAARELVLSHLRLVVSVAYHYQAVYVKFIGTHKEYDAIDAETAEIEV